MRGANRVALGARQTTHPTISAREGSEMEEREEPEVVVEGEMEKGVCVRVEKEDSEAEKIQS